MALVALRLDQPLGTEPGQGLAQDADARAVAPAHVGELQPLAGPQGARQDVGSHAPAQVVGAGLALALLGAPWLDSRHRGQSTEPPAADSNLCRYSIR